MNNYPKLTINNMAATKTSSMLDWLMMVPVFALHHLQFDTNDPDVELVQELPIRPKKYSSVMKG